jgi:hypothetical protein
MNNREAAQIEAWLAEDAAESKNCSSSNTKQDHIEEQEHHSESESSSFYPDPTKWGRYNMFSSCCDKDSAIIFTTGRLPDVNPL